MPTKAGGGNPRSLILGPMALALATLACISVDLSSPPAPIMIVVPAVATAPAATPIVWPTLSPRPDPLLFRVMAVEEASSSLCRFPDLPAGQHVSRAGDYDIKESLAVGPMMCHITRDSCAYNRLVGKLDPSIIYKEEETAPFATEDLLVHPAIVQPLTRLNQLVQSEWNGAVQLRITDAYDSLLSHDPPDSIPAERYSLHYEGRAVDLTTFPVDRELYPRLCALAVCAGFDWVHNEITHCHASVKATSLCELCGD